MGGGCGGEDSDRVGGGGGGEDFDRVRQSHKIFFRCIKLTLIRLGGMVCE